MNVMFDTFPTIPYFPKHDETTYLVILVLQFVEDGDFATGFIAAPFRRMKNTV